MNVVILGSGNLATNLTIKLKKQKFNIVQIYNRTLESAEKLASKVESRFSDKIEEIIPNADLYIFCIKDSGLAELIGKIPSNRGLWLHTSGSIPLDVFRNKVEFYGVIYPLQTFSKDRFVDFQDIPFFIEGNTIETEDKIYNIVKSMSSKINRLSSDKRKYIHLAGVFACNFVNHMYVIAENILAHENISFDVLLPLIEETATKVRSINPHQSQTGPAIRYDENVMNKQLSLITDSETQEIYKIISKNIHKINLK